METHWINFAVIALFAKLVSGTYPVDNPCLSLPASGGPLYHADPSDPTRFIQCDTWGHAFTHACPHGQTWHQRDQTCVQDDGMDDMSHSMDMQQEASQDMSVARQAPPQQMHHTDMHAEADSTQHNDKTAAETHTIMYAISHGRQASSSMQQTKSTHQTKSTQTKSTHATKSSHSHPAPAVNNDYPPAQLYASVPALNNELVRLLLLAATNQAADMSGAAATLSNDEVCAESGQRYLPDRQYVHVYYECRGGQAVRQACPTSQVWVQPIEQCVQIEQYEPPPQEKTTQPVMENAPNVVTGLGDQNPCIGSEVRFHPYPADPSAYLECYVLHRVYLWRCVEGQLWSQSNQACMEVGDSNMDEPQTMDSSSAQTDDVHNPCHSTDSYYHPYPPDDEKFIQCDQFGNMFLQRCGPGKAWDDLVKTCVGNHDMTDMYSDYEYYADYEDVDAREGQVQSDNGEDNADDSEPDQIDPSPDEAIIPVITPLGCPTDHEYDAENHLCIQYNAEGGIAHAVDPLPGPEQACQSGYRFDSMSGGCIPYDAEDLPPPDLSKPLCSAGLDWNPYLNMCVPEGFAGAVDSDAYSLDHNAAYGYNDQDNPYEGAGRQARHIVVEHMAQTNDIQVPPDVIIEDLQPVELSINLPQPLYDIPKYEGENPCQKDGQFYLAFPDDARFYIQCDQLGAMFIQPCDAGRLWNQDMQTCVPPLGPAPPHGHPQAAKHAAHIVGMGDNPCPGAIHTYHPYSGDQHLFIMCVGDVPYIMPCTHGAMWNDDISTCVYPNDQ